MAKERMINTRIWSDTWLSGLDPLEKLLFLYFLTNTYTNISGIYELPLKVAAVETGIDPSMFEKMLPHLEPKVIYKHGWIILPNFPKYQNTENPKIMAGIQRELSSVPKEIHTLSIAYGYPIALIPILNLTKPTVHANAESIVEVHTKEDSSLEENSGDSKSPRIAGDKKKAYDELIKWSEKERGFPFPKTTVMKQYRAFKLANENDIPRERLMEMWGDMESEKFWQKAGFDWMNVLQECLKKPV